MCSVRLYVIRRYMSTMDRRRTTVPQLRSAIREFGMSTQLSSEACMLYSTRICTTTDARAACCIRSQSPRMRQTLPSVAMVASRLLLLVAVSSCLAQLTLAHDCTALGFNAETLQCTDCTKLSQLVKDERLTNECNSCCTSDAAAASGQPIYTSGVLKM